MPRKWHKLIWNRQEWENTLQIQNTLDIEREAAKEVTREQDGQSLMTKMNLVFDTGAFHFNSKSWSEAFQFVQYISKLFVYINICVYMWFVYYRDSELMIHSTNFKWASVSVHFSGSNTVKLLDFTLDFPSSHWYLLPHSKIGSGTRLGNWHHHEASIHVNV